MLTQICDFIHNYFEHAIYNGTFEIVDGTLDVDFLLNGQRFKIIGSALNDGIYTYTDSGIMDDDNVNGVTLYNEQFTGTVIAMSVPKTVLDLAAEIGAWCEANAKALNSPFVSESFNGYTYTKATGSGANAGGVLSWQDVFKSRLNAYRKIA